MLVALWLLTHQYLGLDGDARLYAFQALARIQPALGADVFLRYSSQDRFTVFSPLYAWCIESLGLQYAGMLLAIVCKVWFLTAAWWLARALLNSRMAFLATAALIIVVGRYGAYSVFQYSEDWVTARSLAEALVLTALAFYSHNFRLTGLLIAISALFVHPLMALPGILLLICLWAPTRIGVLGAAAGILASLTLAVVALLLPTAAQVFTVLDPEWLEVVRERSVHLFLQLWTIDDWKLNGKPFITLTIGVLAANDPRIRRLCVAAMLVGATGLAVALIASLLGPVAVLLQGQAWRWVWVTTFAAVLLLVPTAVRLWRDEQCGPICALLLVCGWTFTAVDGVLCTALALGLWLMRNRIPARHTRYLKWGAVMLGVIIVGWMVANGWDIALSRQTVSGRDPLAITRIRNFVGLDAFSVLFVGVLTYWIRKSNSVVLLTMICLSFVTASAFALPGAFKNVLTTGAPSENMEFSDWRSAIPPGSNVFVVPSPKSASFAWFMLERPSYLSTDQSSGVVFSRPTELEIRRRAAVVLPLWDTNWQLEWRRSAVHGRAVGSSASSRPLTKQSLVAVCRDPNLGFVVAKENVGFDPIRHTRSGPWMDWNLYDCRSVNTASPSA